MVSSRSPWVTHRISGGPRRGGAGATAQGEQREQGRPRGGERPLVAAAAGLGLGGLRRLLGLLGLLGRRLLLAVVVGRAWGAALPRLTVGAARDTPGVGLVAGGL